MRSLGSKKFWCHKSLRGDKTYTNKNIRKSRFILVPTFKKLVPIVARIANHNPDYSLYFRGQQKDYKLSSGLNADMSSFYPTIYRSPGKSLVAKDLYYRYKILRECSEELVSKLKSKEIELLNKIKKFPELQWSILQHYEVCDTPLLDVTHSLRVASSFALDGEKEYGYVYVFAFPYPNGTISYSTEDELLNIKLLSACTSEALRPHFQEGFLIGTFPTLPNKKHASLDLGVRLIAKFKIPAIGFWDKDFHSIPHDALYPKDDDIESLCKKIKEQYGS